MGRAPDYLPCTAIGMEHQNDKILKRLGLWHTGCSWYFQILQKLGLSHTSLSLRCSWLSWLAIGSLCVFTAPPPQLLPFLPSIFNNKVFQATFLFLLSLLQFVCFFRPKIKWYVSLHFIVSTLSHRLSYVSDVDQNRADYDGLCVQRHTFFHLLLCLFDQLAYHSGFITCMSLCMSLSPHTRVTSSKSC